MNKKTELQNLAAKNVKNKITEEEVKLRELFDKKEKKEGIHAIADYLVKKHHIKTVSDGKRDIFYLYKDGLYLPSDENALKSASELLLDRLLSNAYASEITGKIKRMTFCKRDEIESNDIDLICVNNGILNIKTLELEKHTPEIFFFRKIPVDYKPKAECPEIKKFFKSVLNKEDIALMQEWFGFPLYRKYFLKKALIIYGEPDTGKTTMINLLIRFIGEKNVSDLALQQLERDRFGTIEMYRKFLNIKDDLDTYDVKSTGAFKMATGQSYITAERKFGDRFAFQNFAKLIFAANKIPSTKEIDDDAYYSRWIIIEFDKVFGGGERDPGLSDKISKPRELSGLLNWALTGLKRLRRRKRFSFNLAVEEVKQLMIKSSSFVTEFLYQELEEAPGEFITKGDMYKIFVRYSRKAKVPLISKEKLGRDILKYSSYIEDRRKAVDGSRQTSWLNVRAKNPMTPVKSLPKSEISVPLL